MSNLIGISGKMSSGKDNSGTIEELIEKVRNILVAEKIITW